MFSAPSAPTWLVLFLSPALAAQEPLTEEELAARRGGEEEAKLKEEVSDKVGKEIEKALPGLTDSISGLGGDESGDSKSEALDDLKKGLFGSFGSKSDHDNKGE